MQNGKDYVTDDYFELGNYLDLKYGWSSCPEILMVIRTDTPRVEGCWSGIAPSNSPFMSPIRQHEPRVEGCRRGLAPSNSRFMSPIWKDNPRVEGCWAGFAPSNSPFVSPMWKDNSRVECNGDDSCGDDGNILPEHTSPNIHSLRDNTSRKGNPSLWFASTKYNHKAKQQQTVIAICIRISSSQSRLCLLSSVLSRSLCAFLQTSCMHVGWSLMRRSDIVDKSFFQPIKCLKSEW